VARNETFSGSAICPSLPSTIISWDEVLLCLNHCEHGRDDDDEGLPELLRNDRD